MSEGKAARNKPDLADYLKGVGGQLRRAREVKEWSLEQLEYHSGLSKTGLWQIEKGRSEPGAFTLYVLAKALGVSVDWLLGVTKEGGPLA